LHQALEIAAGEMLEHDIEVLVPGREDGEELDDVGMGELLEGSYFAESIGSQAVGVVFVYFELFDSNEGIRVVADVARVDYGVCTFSEAGTYPNIRELARRGAP
jgi:hypothetical protein